MKIFAQKKIEITWTLLLICFDSSNILKDSEYDKRFISGSQIIDYASGILNSSDDPLVISLAITNKEDQEQILTLLKRIAQQENRDYTLEFRKFRVLYIDEKLPNENEDFMVGILRINELWDKFGFPIDSPGVYYKFEDFSQSNFEKLLSINRFWVEKELKLLQNILL